MADTEYKSVQIYMKSGNVICLDFITELEIKPNVGAGITSLSMKWDGTKCKQHLLVPSLALDQIEAITYEVQDVQS